MVYESLFKLTWFPFPCSYPANNGMLLNHTLPNWNVLYRKTSQTVVSLKWVLAPNTTSKRAQSQKIFPTRFRWAKSPWRQSEFNHLLCKLLLNSVKFPKSLEGGEVFAVGGSILADSKGFFAWQNWHECVHCLDTLRTYFGATQMMSKIWPDLWTIMLFQKTISWCPKSI